MTLFYLIRHAESDYNLNHSHLVGGRSSHSPLSETGILQAKKLGMRMKREGIRIDNWIASSAVRARQTAEIVMSIVDPTATLIIDETIEEIHQGDWEGKPRIECYTEECLKQINQDNWNFKAPNGESQREVKERMMICIKKWMKKKDDTNAIFTHGVAIKCVLRGIYNWDPAMTYTTDIHNTSLTELEYKKDVWHVRRINDYAHLAM